MKKKNSKSYSVNNIENNPLNSNNILISKASLCPNNETMNTNKNHTKIKNDFDKLDINEKVKKASKINYLWYFHIIEEGIHSRFSYRSQDKVVIHTTWDVIIIYSLVGLKQIS